MALAACGSSRTASPAPAPAGDNDDNAPRQSVDPDAPGFVLPDPHAKGLRPVERPDDPAIASTPPHDVASAVAYRMTGPYADNVAITLSPDGKSVLSYPAPSDLTASSAPLPIADGWYLSRCGITAGSVFTTYTYEAYRALTAPPSPARLLQSVIPGARVAELRTLPLTPAQALDSLALSPASLLPFLR